MSYTTLINASVMMVITSILALIFERIHLKEKLILRKIAGVIVGMVGAIV
ncbi:hypothetical protein [Tenacibaculum sediminilitoris]